MFIVHNLPARLLILLRAYFRPWRWDHYVASKRVEHFIQWCV